MRLTFGRVFLSLSSSALCPEKEEVGRPQREGAGGGGASVATGPQE
ncbi:hypothetical protein AVEN_215928-1, partial [Araneus ventricosus]